MSAYSNFVTDLLSGIGITQEQRDAAQEVINAVNIPSSGNQTVSGQLPVIQNNPFSQQAAQGAQKIMDSFFGGKVGGVPVWAVGAAALVLGYLILKKR